MFQHIHQMFDTKGKEACSKGTKEDEIQISTEMAEVSIQEGICSSLDFVDQLDVIFLDSSVESKAVIVGEWRAGKYQAD